MLPFTEQRKRPLILLGTVSAAARGLQQQPWRAVPFHTRSTLPAPLDFSLLLVIGIRRLCFCHAEPNYCLPEFSQPSPAADPLVALPPPDPCLHREQFRRSKKAILLGVPTTRQQTDATCVLLRPRMPNTRFAKFLRELGCSRSTPAASHKAASLSQEVTLRSPSAVAGCPTHILSEPVLPLRSHHLRACHTLRSDIIVPCASGHEDAPKSVLHVSIVRLSRPILEAVRLRLAISLLLSLGE